MTEVRSCRSSGRYAFIRRKLLSQSATPELLQLLPSDFSTSADEPCIGAGAMKIVVAYSGGLDTSVILKWIKDTYAAEVIAFCADIGQEEELEGLEEKALRTGASKCYVDDLREEFARDFIFPMFQASALYENQYFLGTSIARPLIAKRMVEIARAEKAEAVAHGATGKGNDQVRFELTVAALAPEIEVLAPWRLEGFREQFPGRAEMIQYAEEQGIPVTASVEKAVFDGSQSSPYQFRKRRIGGSLGRRHGS